MKGPSRSSVRSEELLPGPSRGEAKLRTSAGLAVSIATRLASLYRAARLKSRVRLQQPETSRVVTRAHTPRERWS